MDLVQITGLEELWVARIQIKSRDMNAHQYDLRMCNPRKCVKCNMEDQYTVRGGGVLVMDLYIIEGVREGG